MKQTKYSPFEKVYQMPLGKVYPLLVNKATRKGRTQEEVDEIICWLTGYNLQQLKELLDQPITYGDFFRNSPAPNPARRLIKGSICGIRVEEIQEPLMQEIRYLDAYSGGYPFSISGDIRSVPS